MSTVEIGPGDVLAVRATNGFASFLIRLGGFLRDKTGQVDHVVIVTHQDEQGRWMGIEGRPGGVGQCDLTRYLTDSKTRGNHSQPRDPSQLGIFLTSCAKTLGIAYDWVGMAQDTLNSVGLIDLSRQLDRFWRWPTQDGQVPGHVVCSSLAAMLYDAVGWAHPNDGTERICAPVDWWEWNDSQSWLSA